MERNFKMAEETTQNATLEVAKNTTQTDTYIPEWQRKADKLKQAIAEGLGKQVVYDCPQNGGCEPRLSTIEIKTDDYPTVIEEPTGFINPSYNWFGEKRGYFEYAPAAQGQKIEELTDDLRKVAQDQKQIKQEQENADKEKQATDKKNDQALKLMTMISTQMGILNAKVDKLSKPEDTNANKTNPETHPQEEGAN